MAGIARGLRGNATGVTIFRGSEQIRACLLFEAMLANAMRIAEARFGHLLLYDGEHVHAA
jgi:hypothetical protein